MIAPGLSLLQPLAPCRTYGHGARNGTGESGPHVDENELDRLEAIADKVGLA